MTRRSTRPRELSGSGTLPGGADEHIRAASGPARDGDATAPGTDNGHVYLPPELLELICNYVDRRSLRELSRASRAWREVAFIQFVRTIDGKKDRVSKLLKLPVETHLKHIKVARFGLRRHGELALFQKVLPFLSRRALNRATARKRRCGGHRGTFVFGLGQTG
jgi:hypothetical protein